MNVKVARPQIDESDIRAAVEVLRGDQLMQGPRVVRFELAWADYVGAKYCVAVCSGTAALTALLMSAGIGHADEVVVPALGFAAHEWPLLVGATPVFCDIDHGHNLDPEDLPHRLTDKTRAVIVTHLYGGVANMPAILDVVRRQHRGWWRGEDILVIEDCAQAHGARLQGGASVGLEGDAAIWSFMATKNLTTGGEGGAITTNDTGIVSQLRSIRVHGMTGRNTHARLGSNFKMPEMAGAIGESQIRRLGDMQAARRRIAARIIANLADLSYLSLVPHSRPAHHHALFWLPFLVHERRLGMTTEDYRARLHERGIETRHRYVEPLYQQPAVRDYVPEGFSLRNAKRVAGKVIGLPCRPDMTRDEADAVIEAVRMVGGAG